MARYILDIPDKTIAHIRADYGHGIKWINEEDRKILVELIYNAKPINEINWLKEQIEYTPIVRGEWLNVSKSVRDDYLGDVNYAECSVCHSIRVADYFCSCCGADMWCKMEESEETQ